ncbi:hypothetical protein [Rufibacter ruber]|uniref:hypothetical protein n=1 Tax=Rufibacter ruber TaxID=1783499 RepID=UPI00082CF8E7|nr:hypothetical protein [Rufibacter ruber]
MDIIYDILRQRILDQTFITDVREFNNQIQNMAEGKDELFLPSVLIEFGQKEYEMRSAHDKQYGTVDIKFHLVSENYSHVFTDQKQFKDTINTVLNNYSDGVNFYQLRKTSEEQDKSFTNVYVHILTYTTRFIEYIQQDNDLVEFEIDGIQIVVDDHVVEIPANLEPAKVIDGDSVVYLDKGDVYVAVGVQLPVTIQNPNTNQTVTATAGETYTVPAMEEITVSLSSTKTLKTGLKGSKTIGFAGTIVAYSITTPEAGDIEFNIKLNGANFIEGNFPKLVNQTYKKEYIQYWINDLVAGDALEFHVVSSTVKVCQLKLYIKKNQI